MTTGGAIGSSAPFAAADLGASSGRVILGRVGPGRLELTEIRRFRNGAVRLPDGLYWDILGLYQDVVGGLREVAKQDPDLAGIAIDSWAVDYGLLDGQGRMLGNPRHYRDDRTAAVIDRVHAAVPAKELYAVNGLQFLPFNTLYQLAAEPELAGNQALLIPDLLGYWLTGQRVTEETNASTTGLLDASTGEWSPALFDALRLRPDLFPAVVRAGTVIGGITGQVRADTGLGRHVQVSTVGSHDTASAVVGVPAQNPYFAYISCGTWGLVGVELDAPVLSEESRAANFTNERGIDGTIRYLRNVMGLWLLSESIRTWELDGAAHTLTGLIAEAGELPAGGPTFDPDAPQFLPPGDMPTRIAQACADTGQRPPASPAAMVRCILDSLATTFAATVRDAQRLSGRRVDVVHIVGGGSQNELLCQLTADALGKTVIAGPVEATALGNVLVQARTHGILAGDLWALRVELRAAVHTRRYQPRGR